jgi:hypothetical protein
MAGTLSVKQLERLADALAAQRRGLCANHYHRARLRVRKGETTWAALEQAGQALPAGDRRPPWQRR